MLRDYKQCVCLPPPSFQLLLHSYRSLKSSVEQLPFKVANMPQLYFFPFPNENIIHYYSLLSMLRALPWVCWAILCISATSSDKQTETVPKLSGKRGLIIKTNLLEILLVKNNHQELKSYREQITMIFHI